MLLAKPVALLTAAELKNSAADCWKIAPAAVSRFGRCLAAALALTAEHDDRIKNDKAWKIGLQRLPEAVEARNVVLSDHKVRDFVSGTYAHDQQLGLLMDVLAITGARPTQAVRLLVADLHDHRLWPKLSMRKSGKDGSRTRCALPPPSRALISAAASISATSALSRSISSSAMASSVSVCWACVRHHACSARRRSS